MSANDSSGNDCPLHIQNVNGVEVIHLANGNFEDEDSVSATTKALTNLLNDDDPPRRFIINLDTVDYMSSTGLGMLLTFHTRVHKRKHRVVVCNLQPHIDELLNVTNLRKVIETAQDEQAALQALSE